MKKTIIIVFVYIIGFFVFYTLIHQFNFNRLFDDDQEIKGYRSI